MNENGCMHEFTELRYKVVSRPGGQGYKQYKNQCLDCGSVGNPISHSSLSDIEKNTAPEVDPGISTRYWNGKRDELQQNRMEQKLEFFDTHTAYLRSPKWKAKRTAVLRRDGYVCQACLNNPATQVHHLSYTHWGYEPLFELVAVCAPCHEALTTLDQRIRDGEKCRPSEADLELGSMAYREVDF